MKENKLTEQSARQKLIVRTSLVGVLVNVLLAGMKAAVGLLGSTPWATGASSTSAP